MVDATSTQTPSPSLLSLLAQHLTSGAQGGPSAAPTAPPIATAAPSGLGSGDPNLDALASNQGAVPTAATGAPSPTEVGGVTIQAAPRPKPPSPISSAQMSNTNELGVATRADEGAPAAPAEGAGGNNLNYGGVAGALGVHGTLGHVLGALGDAFLIGSGKQPYHVAHAEQQQIDQAMVGAESDPRAAAARVSATGVPGAYEQSQKLIDEANQNDLRKQVQQQNFQYQQSRIGEQTDNTLARRAPAALGFVQGAADAATYAKKYQLLDSQVKGIDPSRSAADAYGIPTPDQWTKGSLTGAGMTTNQQQVSADKGSQRQVSIRDTDVNAGSRIQAAGIGARSRNSAPNVTTMIQGLEQKQNAGQPLTPAEQAIWTHYTAPPRSGGVHLGVQPGGAPAASGGIPIANAGAGNPVANGGKALTPQQASTLPKGTHFLTSDGRWLVRQ